MSYLENPGNGLVRQTVRLGRHDRSGEFMIHQMIERMEQAEVVSRIEGVKNLGRMLRAAEQARELADSWRDFNVGAAAFIMFFNEQSLTWRYEIVHGANAKPNQGGEINVHAEHTLMTKATEFRLPGEVVSIPFICIIGDVQPDQQTGFDSPTLHPCGVCRDAFMEPDTPIGPQTMFVSATSDMRVFEWYSFSALAKFHTTGDMSGIEAYEFDASPLSLTFDPASMVHDGILRMSALDDDALIESDRDVACHLIVPMSHYAHEMSRAK